MQPLEYHSEQDSTVTIWPAFGDLMACLFGLFVLFFTWMIVSQVVLSSDLNHERESREQTEAQLSALKGALAGALAGPVNSGLITLIEDRIGIRGSVLFETNRANLRDEGQQLIDQLAPPLKVYLQERNMALMISGFTDNRAVSGNGEFTDNWELSTQRALTVARALIAAGVPAEWVIAAGFGEHHPVAPNDSAANMALNRRVEISPIHRPSSFHVEDQDGPQPTLQARVDGSDG